MTNFDRIKAMTTEELAEELLLLVTDCCGCAAKNCKSCLIEWLKSDCER